MNFTKLPASSEKLLQELVATDNPAQMLYARFAQASQQEDDELRCILRELREKGYVNLKWADNMPYYVILNNLARTYQEMLAEYRSSKSNQSETPTNTIPVIFISHRSTDKEITDTLQAFMAFHPERSLFTCRSTVH